MTLVTLHTTLHAPSGGRMRVRVCMSVVWSSGGSNSLFPVDSPTGNIYYIFVFYPYIYDGTKKSNTVKTTYKTTTENYPSPPLHLAG